MSKKKATILLGHITHTSINIWVSYFNDISYELFCENINNNEIQFKILKKHNNYTTVFNINNLNNNTKYTFNIGIKKESVLNTTNIITIKTLPLPSYSKKCCIGLASCQYPFPYKSDKIFRAFTNVLDEKNLNITPIIFHVGDQVYADQLNRKIPLRRADTHEEFKALYENKFKGEYFSKFCSKYPSLMTLDDHEIEDNWSMDRLNEKRDLFVCSMNAYKIYQMSHGPNLKEISAPLYYTTNIGIYNFFILDTRTDRYNANSDLLGNPANKQSQFSKLCEWLLKQDPNVPKFIISSVIFAPISQVKIKNNDNWNGYKTRDELLKFIIDNNIQKIVFLSGDIHNSLAVTISLKYKNKEIKLYQIISSPLYWPFPFADGDIANYILNAKDLKMKIKDSNKKKWQYSYECHLSSYTQLNNFAIIDFNSNQLDVNWYGVDERVLAYHTIIF